VAARILIDGTGATRLSYTPIAPSTGGDNPAGSLGKFSDKGWTFHDFMMENDRNYQKNHNEGLMSVGQFGMLDTSDSFQILTWYVQILPIKCEFLACLKRSPLCSQRNPGKSVTNSLDSIHEHIRHEHIRLLDFTVSESWNAYNAFPFICGHLGNETELFLKQINIVAKPWELADIFRDRAPRVLHIFRFQD
jgi:hypothetical protein